jgi:hypothetical protein
MFMGIENSNQGPGWHDHDTPMALFTAMMVILVRMEVVELEGMLVVGIPVLLQIHG